MGLQIPWGPLLGGLLRVRRSSGLTLLWASGGGGRRDRKHVLWAWGWLRGRTPGPLPPHREELRSFWYLVSGLLRPGRFRLAKDFMV